MPATPITVVTPGTVGGQGSYAEFELDPTGNPGVYVALCFDEIPEIMVESEQIETTQVCQTTKSYINGVSDTPEINLTTHDDTGNADLQTLITAAKARDVVSTRFVYANGATSTFDLQFLAYGRGGASGSDPISIAFKGKVNGDIVDGTVV